MQIVHYPYGEFFQFKILALMVQDPVFLAVYSDAINPNFFERAHLNTTCQLILWYFQHFRAPPEYGSLSACIEEHVLKYHIVPDVANSLRQTANWIFSNPVNDSEYVKERVLRFGQRQALKGACNGIIDRLEKDEEFDDCRRLVETALQVGLKKDGGFDLGLSLPWLPQLAMQSETYRRRVPTAMPNLDRCLSGGLGVGELGIIVAPSGVGKSTTLVNFGYGAIMSGLNVLHVTLELKEIDIALKYAARHTMRPINSIIQQDPYFYQMAYNYPISENRLKIKYFSPGTITVSNIRALLSYLRGNGFMPDLLIVDYIKKMKYDSEETGGLGKISNELVTLGDDYHCAVWTAQQAQRNLRFAARTPVSGISNDISIVENADVALAISQTEDEHREDRFRIELGKVRRGDDIYILFCQCNYAMSYVRELTEGEAAALYGANTSGGQNP